MRILLCFLFFAMLIAQVSPSCKKDDADLPVGAGTIVCLLNGEQWEPCLKDELIPGGGLFKLTVTTGKRSLSIRAIRNCKNGQDESLAISCISIADDLSIGKWEMSLTDRLGCGYYRLDSTYNNTLQMIRFDQTSDPGVATGVFDVRFVPVEQGCVDTIYLSNGRFNLGI